VSTICLLSCKNKQKPIAKMTPKLITSTNFDTIIDHKKVTLYTLKNKTGALTQITNYGGTVVSLWVQDKDGNYDDIVLGYNSIADYVTNPKTYFGALIGRYGNRIAKGKFSINNTEYSLATNNNENHLHGGAKGYDAVVWDAQQINEHTLELKYLSPDMEEGYPGNLSITIQYQLTDANELKVEYWATTDKTTIVNLTHHSYFNLKGEGNGTINDHLVHINASRYTPVDATLIPTGELALVKDTPMDFTTAKALGSDINADYEQLNIGSGYDHNYVLEKSTNGISLAAKVTEPTTGRIMELYTTEPGVQLYSGNFLDGAVAGKSDKPYAFRSAFCMETQHFPNSPNTPEFPSVVLQPDEKYHTVTIHKFSTMK
tara:strand:+ start:1234 stop:2352 length:1119 start_codon:yes stop_codon:yes gene_type:complete